MSFNPLCGALISVHVSVMFQCLLEYTNNGPHPIYLVILTDWCAIKSEVVCNVRSEAIVTVSVVLWSDDM